MYSVCVYLFLLMVEELSGDELLLVLLAVSEAVVVLVKILLPGTVRGLFTAPSTGAGLGCTNKDGRVNWGILNQLAMIVHLIDFYLSSEQHLSHVCHQVLLVVLEVLLRGSMVESYC